MLDVIWVFYLDCEFTVVQYGRYKWYHKTESRGGDFVSKTLTGWQIKKQEGKVGEPHDGTVFSSPL